MIKSILTFFYPAFMSYKSLTNHNQDVTEDKAVSSDSMKKWLSYWAIFAIWHVLDDVIDFAFSWFPYYGLIESVLFVMLYNGNTNGSLKMYEMVVAPWFSDIDSYIGGYVKTFEKVLKIES